MKVAILNRDRNSHPGGDLIHIDNLNYELGKMGCQRDYFDGCRGGDGVSPDELAEYDLIHIYHSNHTFVRECVSSALEVGKPTVMTCIFVPVDPELVGWREVRSWLQSMNRVIMYSAKEQEMCQRITGFTGDVDFIYPGVGDNFYGPDNVFGRDGVLTVEARAGAKNSGLVTDICSKLGLPFRGVTGGVNHSFLPDIYRRAKVYVLASSVEAWGHTVLESLAAGCRSVITDVSGTLEYLPGMAVFPPDDEQYLTDLIEYAYSSEGWNYVPNKEARKMTWKKAAEKTFRLYKEVLDEG